MNSFLEGLVWFHRGLLQCLPTFSGWAVQASSVLSPELIKHGFLSLTNLLEKQVTVFNANKAQGQSVGLFGLFLGRQEYWVLSVKAPLRSCPCANCSCLALDKACFLKLDRATAWFLAQLLRVFPSCARLAMLVWPLAPASLSWA